MKSKFLKLLKKHKIKRNSYYKDNPYTKEGVSQFSHDEVKLLEKWNSRVSKGWYGVSLGQPTPNSWFKMLDDFLSLVEKYNPDFEIYQIKSKYGGIRIHVGLVNQDTCDCIGILEREMFDQYLIY